jgi:putative YphP/YqiW family bacilliredoxin
MPYPEILIKPMRDELTQIGVQETRSPQEVDAAVQQPGTVMIIVNSVCGCAAGKARPGIAMALKNRTLPDRIVTVFAGADIEATDHARGYFKGYPPSSPSVGLLRDGELVYILQRHQIEGREAPQIAGELTAAFDRYCTKEKVVS